MDASKTFPTRLLCSEPLERRWLLSGVAPSAGDGDGDEPDDVEDAIDARAHEPGDDGDAEELAVAPADEAADVPPLTADVPPAPPAQPADSSDALTATDGVELVEWEVTAPDEIEEEVTIAVSALPRVVLNAFAELFPGATPIEGQYGVDDGEPEFDVLAEVEGRVVDATFTPGGELIETEHELTSGELPREVLDWVRDNFGDAPIDEASVQLENGVISYEVTVADAAGGDQDVEATLRVPGAAAPDLPGIGDSGEAGGEPESTPPSPTPIPDSRFAAGIPAPTAPSDSADAETTNDSGTSDPGDVAGASHATSGDPANAIAAQAMGGRGTNGSRERSSIADAARGLARSARVSAALEALVAESPPDAWLPRLEGMLSDVFPLLDASGIEQRLDELLAEIDALVQRLALDGARAGFSPSHLAVAAALVAVAQLYFLNARRAGAGPTLVFNAAGTTWSWVLGTPTTTTPRANAGIK